MSDPRPPHRPDQDGPDHDRPDPQTGAPARRSAAGELFDQATPPERQREPLVGEPGSTPDGEPRYETEVGDHGDIDQSEPVDEPAASDGPVADGLEGAGDDEFDDESFEEYLEDEGEDAGRGPAWARGRWSTAALVATGVAGALVAALIYGVATWTWPGDGESGEIVGRVDLVPMASYVGNARALVIERDDQVVLRIEAQDLPDTVDSYNQVWLLDSENGAELAIPVGIMDSTRSEWSLPSTLDWSGRVPVVAVTQELYDGNPGPSSPRLWLGRFD